MIKPAILEVTDRLLEDFRRFRGKDEGSTKVPLSGLSFSDIWLTRSALLGVAV